MTDTAELIKCNRCSTSKPICEFVGTNKPYVKTCFQCRGKLYVRPKADNALNARKFRAENPGYDKRNRAEYYREYRLRKKMEREKEKADADEVLEKIEVVVKGYIAKAEAYIASVKSKEKKEV